MMTPWVAPGVFWIFALLEVVFLWYGLSETVRFVRCRALRLELSRLPATTGSVIAVALNVPFEDSIGNEVSTTYRYAVRLEAIQFKRDSSGRRVNPRVMHQEDVKARVLHRPRGTRLRFELRIPGEAPPSQGYGVRWTPATGDRVYLRWILRISVTGPGGGLTEVFEIPVIRATAAEAASAALAADTPPAPPSSALLPAPPGIPSFVSAQEGGRWVIRQPPWNRPGMRFSDVLGLMAFFGSFIFVGVLTGWYLHHWAAYAVGGFFAATGLLFTGTVLVLHASELRAEVSRFDGLLIRRSLWGLRLEHVVLDRARIGSVEVLVETGSHGGTPDHSVVVREHRGTVHRVAESIPTAREAEALRDQVIARLGLVTSAETGNASRATAAAADRRFQRRA